MMQQGSTVSYEGGDYHASIRQLLEKDYVYFLSGLVAYVCQPYRIDTSDVYLGRDMGLSRAQLGLLNSLFFLFMR